MCDQGHRFIDIQKYTFGQCAIFLKNSVKKEKNKQQEVLFKRVHALDDTRFSYHSDAKDFKKYKQQLLKFTEIQKDTNSDSTQAAKELLNRGVACHGRK